MLSLTEDLLELCIARLSPRDIIACSSTCKKLDQIVTESIPIQYRLHQHLYQDNEESLPSGPYQLTSAGDRLSRLIKRQKAFSEFKPTLSSYILGEDQDIVCAYGDHIATVLGWRLGAIAEPDQDGQYALFSLITLGNSKLGGKVEIERKSYTVPFIMLRGATLIDISKNVVIAQEEMENYMHVKLHIFKVFNQGQKVEHQGAGTMEVNVRRERTWEGLCRPKLSLGPEDTFYITTGRIITFYSWKDGLHKYTIRLPAVLEKPHFLQWAGYETIVIRALYPSMHSDKGKSNRWTIPQTLSIYRTQDLTAALTTNPTPPYLVLLMPSEISDLPDHIRDEIPYWNNPDCLISPGRVIQTGSKEAGILHLAICVDTYSNAAVQIMTGVSIGFPPGKLNELMQAVTSGEPDPVDPNVDWIRRDFKISSDVPIISAQNWRNCCFWALNSALPARQDSHIHRMKLVTYDDTMTRNQGEQGGIVKLMVFDFNPRILNPHTTLGHALGGLGQKMQLEDDGDEQESISTTTSSNSTGALIYLQEGYPGAIRYEMQHTYKGDPVASVHYDGEMIILEHEDSTIDVWDFTSEGSI